MPTSTQDEPRLAPHPTLREYYRDEGQRRRFLDRVFDDTAPHYDWIIGLMSFGSGGWYRRFTLQRAGLVAGMKVLDVAVGTGAVARAAVELAGPTGLVVGLDPSVGMLKQAVKSLGIPVVQAVAERLPFADASFDFLSMGYALRHVADLRVMLAEYRRVVRPGGTVAILDFARPTTRIGLAASRLFLNRIIPTLARLGSGMRQAELLMHYCWDTVENLVEPQTILQAMTEAGFEDIRHRTWFGVLSEYIARR